MNLSTDIFEKSVWIIIVACRFLAVGCINALKIGEISIPVCQLAPLREEKSLSQRAFSIYTDIRKLQDKAKTSYTLSTRRLRFGYE